MTSHRTYSPEIVLSVILSGTGVDLIRTSGMIFEARTASAYHLDRLEKAPREIAQAIDAYRSATSTRAAGGAPDV